MLVWLPCVVHVLRLLQSPPSHPRLPQLVTPEQYALIIDGFVRGLPGVDLPPQSTLREGERLVLTALELERETAQALVLGDADGCRQRTLTLTGEGEGSATLSVTGDSALELAFDATGDGEVELDLPSDSAVLTWSAATPTSFDATVTATAAGAAGAAGSPDVSPPSAAA